MMRLCVVILNSLLIQTYGLYVGEECFIEENQGICVSITECQSLLSEIRQAGSPISNELRQRLQGYSCGFDGLKPLVCCLENGTTVPDLVVTKEPDPIPTPEESQNGKRSSSSTDETENKSGDVTGHRNMKLLPKSCGTIESNRIFGGNRTALYEMPWMVLLAYEARTGPKYRCAGTLITERYVLTAAHCVSFLGTGIRLSAAILGEHDIRSDPDCERTEGDLFCAPVVKTVSIETIKSHPGYTPQTASDDDIALLKLAEPADFTLDTMKPICLPVTYTLQKENLTGLKGDVTGWGTTEDGPQSPVLLSVRLPIISNEECQKIYNGRPNIADSQLCAGGEKNKDSCGGDSGGPLMYPGTSKTGIRYVQRGIISFGSKRCGLGGFPGIYTRVSNYMDWILDNID